MRVEDFVRSLKVDFFTGVPDSLLKSLSSYLMNRYGIDGKHHIIAANEGNAIGLAAGYHLSTGKVPAVYMQNSGQGNDFNPIASLLNSNVYGIPCIFIIGWRGEPGINDEPQHIFQGKITEQLLEDIDIDYTVLSKKTQKSDIDETMKKFDRELAIGRQVAFIVEKDALTFDRSMVYKNQFSMIREDTIRRIVNFAQNDIIISTTGKISRELFEIREENGQSHNKDFLTVGSMGHSSSIALEIALQKEKRRVWCFDGDGALLMHMGAMAVIGSMKPANLVHVVMNNCAHESVGGMPTVISDMNLSKVAEGCGYEKIVSVENEEDLEEALALIQTNWNLTLLEIKCAIGSRSNLGRPTLSAKYNKEIFMQSIVVE